MKPFNLAEVLNEQTSTIQIDKNSSLFLYGAGNFGRKVCRTLLNEGYKIAGFLDQKSTPHQFCDQIPVYSPDSDEISLVQKQETITIITLHNRDVDLLPIVEKLNRLGYAHVLNAVNYFNILPPTFGDQYWLTSSNSYKKWMKEIEECYDLWQDNDSRSLYISILMQRIKGDYALLPYPDLDHQYFPKNIPSWKNPIRFVDCGAYDGDTLLQMKSQGIIPELIIAFEPDLNNFTKLSKNISTEWGSPALLFPCGVHSSTVQMHFESDNNEGGNVNEKGNIIIQAVALDDVLNHLHPNLIKMDIEGAEVDALLGAKKIIEEDRPGLAICVYHRPQHLWQIPEMINRWNLGYKFYLRSHAFNGFDIVMYAVHS